MKRVELIDVSKSYDKQVDVISNINVTIEPGEFFVLVGPSGCGKSTMLRMIAGLEEITGGTLKIGDTVANHLTPNKRDLSMVFQNYALLPHISVQQNITFGLDVKRMKKEDQRKKAADVAEMLGLTDYLDRKPRELSGGQRQRVALARAIVNEKPICLMDEPLSNLDAKLRAQMRSEIRRIQRSLGITMIYVTHDQVEAMTMGDRIMILHEGKIQQIGKPIDIYNYPANPFVATFIGSPPMNLAKAEFNEADQQLVLGDKFKISVPVEEIGKLPRTSMTVGLRPENLYPKTSDKKEGDVFEVEVTNVEILGNETIFSFKLGKEEWMAKWSGQWHIDIGDRLSVHIDFESLSIFEEKSGELIKKTIDYGNYVANKEVSS
ncbi:sn-glycerol-3-phosphate ABC transporter ATP-binding protein UgpC [Sporosarcina thermotolerans]|uniref:Sn-glycerol-3-phosphate ABC transporter ATP-binding protein UgpC n=1 Tax=Sporosarcina thermotolerans TaxID=633404 RepID=A0AAW9AB88_9BACL|nr:sn-glycerol-3-phosphate ABC transporter ATP-binding protein UgpC [Sporosarcina thermotolerans]MDW0116871.1 sn-glycerol-3-phosphate ABC transporter ATP-binding protein UgpC [Sporosarcina thermotolerans]